MKKGIVVLFVLFSLFTFAQTTKLRFGVHAGLNYSGLRGYTIPADITSQYDESAAFGYLGGISLTYPLKEKVSLRVELNYERKTQKADNIVEIRNSFEEPAQLYDFTSKRHFDYLVMPILLHYQFTDNNSFFVNGGPFVGYLLKATLTSDIEAPELNADVDLSNDYKKLDYGLTVGLGKHFDIGSQNSIHLEIRNNLGLAKINKNDVWNGGHVRTNSLSFMVGYSF
ncbi:MAG: porin family protein [Flavobacterium sp.]|jgi:hypothetical protein|uniref:porin family protein n=1 Tax=Flavobacterium sp. TaxID=239 RepID=UPI003BA5FE3C